MTLRVAFAGTPEFACPALGALCAVHQVVGVLTQPDRPQGRGRQLGASPVKSAALARALPLAQPATLKTADGRAALEHWAPEVLIVVAYGLLLPPEVLALPRYGCLNIHASLLPRWRGAAPIERAILAGDAESGISIMQMDAGLDTGPVLLRRRHLLSRGETGGSLHAALATLGAAAILEALTGLEAGTLVAEPQPAEGATYAAKITKAEARIDWDTDAPAIERRVRAFQPRPVAETIFEGRQLRIHAAVVVSNGVEKKPKDAENGDIVGVSGDLVLVKCATGLLGLARVQLPGRNPVSGREFAQSHPLLGRRLG